MAPEIFEMQEYDAKADIWSVGCVFYEMLGNDDVWYYFMNFSHAHFFYCLCCKEVFCSDSQPVCVMVSPSV